MNEAMPMGKGTGFRFPNFRRKKEEGDDLGFGRRITTQRLIRSNGTFNVERRGIGRHTPYEILVKMSWRQFFLFVILSFVLTNACFALGFVLLGVDMISGVTPENWLHDFAHAFFFSVQTFTTVGYGAMSPIGLATNLLASLCALVGLMAFALATGLFFARFSKPEAHIVYSDHALIAPTMKEGNDLQFRIANLSNNKMVNVNVVLTISWVELKKGEKLRRFTQLPVKRNKVMWLPLNWTIAHPITSSSPLYEMSEEDLEEMEVEIIVFIEAFDETYAQTVYSNTSYTHDEILWNKRFLPMYHVDEAREITILRLDEINAMMDIEA